MKKIVTTIAALALSVLAGNTTLAASDNSIQALVDQRVEQKLQEYLNSEAFDQRVEQSIIKFVQKQERTRAEQAKAKAEKERIDLQAKLKHLPLPDKRDYLAGNKDAAYTLVTYTDFECPFCKKFHGNGQQFIERNPDVNWAYRHFPLSFHNPGAQKQAEAAECAGEQGGPDAFWAYSDKIMERTASNGKGFPIANLVPLAAELGLDEQKFATCLEDNRYAAKIEKQISEAAKAGVTGTPGNFLIHNATGEIVRIKGAQPLEVLEQTLNGMKSHFN